MEAVCKRGALELISSGRYILSGLGYRKKLAEDIARKLDLGPEDRLFDLGCNVGIYHSHLYKKVGWLTGVDAGPSIVERAKRTNRFANTEYLCFDILAEWPELKLTYSKVLIYSVIHFFETSDQVDQLIKRISKHLDPNGQIMFGEVRTKQKYEKFRDELPSRKIPTFRDLKFKFNKWFNRLYLGEPKGHAAKSYEASELKGIADTNGFDLVELDQQSFHPFYNTCSDFILSRK
jgi:cyclopropane fatty-acyl-phospholipid synthase-like methyltransferase